MEQFQFAPIGIGIYNLFGDTLLNAIDNAYSHGCRLVDTASLYNNESALANIIKNKQDIIVQTKISGHQLKKGRFRYFYLDKVTISDVLKKTLQNLKKDKISILLLHAPFSGFENEYEELINYQKKGTIEILGVCNFDEIQIDKIKQRCGVYPQINQIEVHPFHTNKNLIYFCKEHNILVEARSPFAHGDAMDEFMANDILKKIAKRCKKSIPQIILRWLIQQDIIPIFRSQNVSHIHENLDVFSFELSHKQMQMIDSLNRDYSYGYVSSNSYKV